MKNKRVALVEIGGSHDECLLTQMRALNERGSEVLLFTTEEVANRNPAFHGQVMSIETFTMNGTKSDQKREVGRLWKALKNAKVETVVFNTAQGKWIRALALKALFSKITCVGVIHTSRMFKESFTQKMISFKVKKYLVLSEFLKNDCQKHSKLDIDYFYPLDFPEPNGTVRKEANHVVIIGGVEKRRKDLEGFLTLMDQAPDTIRWTFLGKTDKDSEDAKAFIQAIESRGCTDRVTLFTGFVDQQQFVDTIASATCILPLIHPETPSADQYFKNQIPGAMSVALSFKIPMLVHEGYQHWTELKNACVYYNFENFASQLEDVITHTDRYEEAMKNTEAYSMEAQRERFARFVLD